MTEIWVSGVVKFATTAPEFSETVRVESVAVFDFDVHRMFRESCHFDLIHRNSIPTNEDAPKTVSALLGNCEDG
ncbi:hypothetical protein [Halomonas sp. BC04]|uniref:hypothetical protein n=1 Tax=Halomonas sp. BC04 TaxID=1403540 RepID=UPI001E5AE5D1|nr:hypothetical protein [Halomonas sp. BC04]